MYLHRLCIEPGGLHSGSTGLPHGPQTQAYPVFECPVPTMVGYRMELYLSLVRLSANNLSSSTPFLSQFFKIWPGNPTAGSPAMAPKWTLAKERNRTAVNAKYSESETMQKNKWKHLHLNQSSFVLLIQF